MADGQESKHTTWRLAKRNLAIRGTEQAFLAPPLFNAALLVIVEAAYNKRTV